MYNGTVHSSTHQSLYAPLNVRQVPIIIIIIIILLLWLLCSLFANNDDVAGRKMRLKALRVFNVQCI